MKTIRERWEGFLRRMQGRKFCALDFDSRRLRIVQAEHAGDSVRITKLATTDLPEGLNVTDPQIFGAFLGQALDRLHLGRTWVVMCVPRGQSILKPLVMPAGANQGELAAMVQYQAEKELAFRPDEAVVDFAIESHFGAAPATGENAGEGQQVLVAAVKRPVVDFYRQVAAAAGVHLLRLGLRPYADMRSVEAHCGYPRQGRLALVHITADDTEIDVIDDGALMFSRAAGVKVAADEAGSAAAAASIVAEVARSLQSYLGVESGHRIDKVLLAGGTGIEPQVAKDLGRKLSVHVEVANPGQALGIEGAGQTSGAFLSALGMALGQAENAQPPFDFLNPKRPPVQRDMKRVAAIATAAGLVLVLLTAFATAALRYYAATSEVSSLESRYGELTSENQKVTKLAKRVETINRWVRGGRDWLDQWAYLSEVFPSCTDVYISNLKANPDGSLSFTVKAKSNDAINDLGRRLTEAGYGFKPGQVSTTTDLYGYGYSTNVKVVVKPTMEVDLASASAAPRPQDDVSSEQFGRPVAAGTARMEAARPVQVASSDDAVKEWVAKYQKLMADRPSMSQIDAYNKWKAQRDALLAVRPAGAEIPSVGSRSGGSGGGGFGGKSGKRRPQP